MPRQGKPQSLACLQARKPGFPNPLPVSPGQLRAQWGCSLSASKKAQSCRSRASESTIYSRLLCIVHMG